MITSGIVIASAHQSDDALENNRYLIKSDNGALKAMFGVNHIFDNGFTTDLSPGQLKIIEKFGVEVEQVPIYYILGKPVCDNDGECEPGENPSCADCKSEDTEPEPIGCFPSTSMPWGIVKVNGGTGGEGVLVAVLDTGVDRDHPDLASKIDYCVAFGYRKCDDGNGHGTHVSGTILAKGKIIGVAPEARLMAVKILSDRGSGYADDIAKGIRYAADNGAEIISMSLGSSTESSLIKDATAYAVGKGVLVVAAAGNSGPALNTISYPAADPNVVAVAAFDSSGITASFSSRGINDNDWTIEAREIEFIAPGVSVESTLNDGCYAVYSGTSMATPHISGIAARDWKGSASETRTYLQGLAKAGIDYGLTGDDVEAGFGLPI